MPTFDPYNAAGLGPSAGATMAKAADVNQTQTARNDVDYSIRLASSNYGFGQPGGDQGSLPQLQSSLGASGQYGSGAGNNAMHMAQTQHALSNADVTTQFERAGMDLTRNQVYAAMGIIL